MRKEIDCGLTFAVDVPGLSLMDVPLLQASVQCGLVRMLCCLQGLPGCCCCVLGSLLRVHLHNMCFHLRTVPACSCACAQLSCELVRSDGPHELPLLLVLIIVMQDLQETRPCAADGVEQRHARASQRLRVHVGNAKAGKVAR